MQREILVKEGTWLRPQSRLVCCFCSVTFRPCFKSALCPSIKFDSRFIYHFIITKMVPENVTHSVDISAQQPYLQPNYQQAEEMESSCVTAWKRYQRLMYMMESRGAELNQRNLIEAVFRGVNLISTAQAVPNYHQQSYNL